MATVTHKIDTYKYFMMSNRYGSDKLAADIWLYNGELWIAALHFHYDAEAANRPPFVFSTDPVRIRLHFHMSEFDRTIDTLRSEEPVYLSYDISAQRGWLGTSEREPVGEEES